MNGLNLLNLDKPITNLRNVNYDDSFWKHSLSINNLIALEPNQKELLRILIQTPYLAYKA